MKKFCLLFPILLVLIILIFPGCQIDSSSYKTIYKDGEEIFVKHGVEGSFVLLNLDKNDTIIVNEKISEEGFLPASTFKIPNTIIGLETGVIPDINFSLKWDGVVNDFVSSWNRDHNLASAMKNSVVWFYQEVARKIGEKRYKEYLEHFNYGNQDISAGVDKFWLTGGMRITPLEQVIFLSKLLGGDFPVSKRSIDILKNVLPVSTENGITIYAKTGLTEQEGKKIGWLIGFLEKDKLTHLFSCVLIGPGNVDWRENPVFNARKEVPLKILSDLKLIPENMKFPG